MVRLLLVRHAETTMECSAAFPGHTDVPLSPCGQRQVVALVQALRAETIHACYTSDLCRAWEPPRPWRVPEDFRCARNHVYGRWRLASGRACGPLTSNNMISIYWRPGTRTPCTLLHLVGKHWVKWRTVSRQCLPTSSRCTRSTPCCSSAMEGRYVCSFVALGLSPRAYWQFGLAPAAWAELQVYAEGAVLERLNITGTLA